MTYKISSTNTLPTEPSHSFTASNLNPTVSATRQISVTDSEIIGSTEFYIHAKNGWGTEYWSPKITLNVICMPTSTFLIDTGFTNSLTNWQFVSAADAVFMLPLISTHNPGCPV